MTISPIDAAGLTLLDKFNKDVEECQTAIDGFVAYQIAHWTKYPADKNKPTGDQTGPKPDDNEIKNLDEMRLTALMLVLKCFQGAKAISKIIPGIDLKKLEDIHDTIIFGAKSSDLKENKKDLTLGKNPTSLPDYLEYIHTLLDIVYTTVLKNVPKILENKDSTEYQSLVRE